MAVNGDILGLIAINDALKEYSTEAVSELSKLGIESIMLTGDNEWTARAIAVKVGIKRVIAKLTSNEKLDIIKKFQLEGVLSRWLAMV